LEGISRRLGSQIAADSSAVYRGAYDRGSIGYNKTDRPARAVAAVLPTFNAMHPPSRNGRPADAAEALLFLASDQAGFITGVVPSVDGGVMAGRQ